jgi:hypothetical protein
MSSENPSSRQGEASSPNYGSGYVPPPGYTVPPGYVSPPGYVPPPGYAPPPYSMPGMVQPLYVSPTPPTNGLAVAALVCGILGICGGAPSIAAIICGHLSLSQIKESNGTQSGDGMARAGLIMGYVGLGLWVILIVAYIVFFATIFSQLPKTFPTPTVGP